MNDYAKELAKEVLDWYNIYFNVSESSITLVLFNREKFAYEEVVFSSWEDVLCEMLSTMELSNKDTFDEIGELLWKDEEISYVKRLGKQAIPSVGDGMDVKRCPCCGERIMVGQEVCLNCKVYLWEVVLNEDHVG